MIGDLLWRCESTSALGILLPEEGTAVALFEGGYWVRGSMALERALALRGRRYCFRERSVALEKSTSASWILAFAAICGTSKGTSTSRILLPNRLEYCFRGFASRTRKLDPWHCLSCAESSGYRYRDPWRCSCTKSIWILLWQRTGLPNDSRLLVACFRGAVGY